MKIKDSSKSQKKKMLDNDNLISLLDKNYCNKIKGNF